MAGISLIARPVFHAPTKGRSYLTAKAAASNEAASLIEVKYPRERPAYENGYCYDPGYHWSEDERLQKVHSRLSRMILRAFRNQQRAAKSAKPEG